MPESTSRRVLFVDDEPNLLMGLRRMLRGKCREWDMTFVESGEEALRQFADKTFDVIVSDMRMPGLDGVKLLEQVRDSYPGTVRMLLSGQAEPEALLKSLSCTHQFIAKPCEPKLLIDSVQRALALKGIIANPNIINIVSRLIHVPSLSTVFYDLLNEIRSENATLTKVGEIIARDLGMTAKVLQLVNSAFFGLRVEVTSPIQAAKLLGLELIASLALSIQIFALFDDSKVKGFSLAELTQHSLLVGMTAKQIAAIYTSEKRALEYALIAGILHDVGKLVIADNLPDEYSEVIERGRAEGLSITQAELETFNCTHADIGAFLIALWGLPEDVVEAVAYHHRPEEIQAQSFSTLTALYIANSLGHQPADAKVTLVEEPYIAQLGLSKDQPQWQQVFDKTLKRLG